jgi:hypothetical protein
MPVSRPAPRTRDSWPTASTIPLAPWSKQGAARRGPGRSDLAGGVGRRGVETALWRNAVKVASFLFLDTPRLATFGERGNEGTRQQNNKATRQRGSYPRPTPPDEGGGGKALRGARAHAPALPALPAIALADARGSDGRDRATAATCRPGRSSAATCRPGQSLQHVAQFARIRCAVGLGVVRLAVPHILQDRLGDEQRDSVRHGWPSAARHPFRQGRPVARHSRRSHRGRSRCPVPTE